jgi:hypothetical protein
VNHSPKLIRTVTSWVGSNTKFEKNDLIAIIDEEAGNIVKGQNQRTYDIVTFPRDILEKNSANTAKLSNSFINKSNSAVTFNNKNQHGTNSLSREKSLPLNKQFAYHKFKDERGVMSLGREDKNNRNARVNKPSPARPPAPRLEPRNGILIDLSPEEMNSLESSINSKDTPRHSVNMTSCILDEPIPGTIEEFYPNENEFSNLQINDVMQENVYQNQNSKYNAENFYQHTYDIANGSENVYNNEDVFSTQHINLNSLNINNPNMTNNYNIYSTAEGNFYDSVYSSAIYETANNFAQPLQTTHSNYNQTSIYNNPGQNSTTHLSEQQINRRMTANSYNNVVRGLADQLMEALKHEQITLVEANVAQEMSNGTLEDAIKMFKIKRLER